MQRQCNGGPFGEVLYADAERERTGRRDQSPAAAMLCGACKRQADGHSFGNIVQGYREYKQRRASERGRQSFCARRTVVQMRQQAVQQQHKQDAENKAA